MTAAVRLFAEQGFAATSIRQIVEACSCTNPSLYYYFPSKEELFRRVVQAQIDHIAGFLRNSTAEAGPIRERMQHALTAFVDFGSQHPESFRLLHRLEGNAEDGAPKVDMSAARKLHLDLMVEMVRHGVTNGEIRPGVDPSCCALAMAGIVNFQLQMALCSGEWHPRRIRQTLDLLFDGIAV